MPQYIIDQVKQIGKKELDTKGLALANQKQDILDYEGDDPEFNLEHEVDTEIYSDIHSELPGVLNHQIRQ